MSLMSRMMSGPDNNTSSFSSAAHDTAATHLKRIAQKVRKPIRMRMVNALDHFERSIMLFDLDREMSSFRVLTGQEEAATALMMALQTKGYEGASYFNLRSHKHKAAVGACVTAIAQTLQPLLSNYEMDFNFARCRIDVRLPLGGVRDEDGRPLFLQFQEPLGLLHANEGEEEPNIFKGALDDLMNPGGFRSVSAMVKAQANLRNNLLYASDQSLPRSSASAEQFTWRYSISLTMLVLTVMVLQAPPNQPLPRQAMPAFLSIVQRTSENADDA